MPLVQEPGSDASEETAPQLLLRELRLNFPEAYQRYFESLASMWTLDGLGRTRGAVLIDAMDDPDPHVAAAAVRLSESLLAGGVWICNMTN